jgi:TolB-like protein
LSQLIPLQPEPQGAYEFCGFTLDLRRMCVWHGSTPILMEPRAFDVLTYLITHKDQLVSQDELLGAIWKETFVTPNAVTRTVAQIRKLFGDDARNPHIIQTVSKRGYRFIASVAELRAGAEPPSGVPAAVRGSGLSIAVLPFVNLSVATGDEYLVEGLAEEILNTLTHVPNLTVMARHSAFAFRSTDRNLRDIGRRLGVRTLLEGSLRRSGDRVRIAVQLVDTVTEHQIWSERYERNITDVFSMQDEISSAIVAALVPKLLSQRPASTAYRTENVDAWHAYLKSRYHLSKMNLDALVLSQAFSEEAIRRDPGYAAAHTQLAECLLTAAIFGAKPATEAVPRAKTAALTALALNDNESGAYAVLAHIAGEYEHNWESALERCYRALQCQPLSVQIRRSCAQFVLWPLHRYGEVRRVIEPAIAADPLSPMPRFVLAMNLLGERSWTRAIEEMNALLEFDARFWPPLVALGVAYTISGCIPDAIVASERGLSAAPWNAFSIGLLAGNYERSGDAARARAVLDQLGKLPVAGVRALGQAVFSLVRSDFTRAADQFNEVIQSRYPLAAYYFAWMSLFEGFPESPGVRGLRMSLGLPASAISSGVS